MPQVILHDLLAEGQPGLPRDDLRLDRFPGVVGRGADCDGRLGGPFVSRRHCRFFLGAGGEVYVEDLGSRNGTTLNREPLTCACALHDDDLLGIGGLPFRVCLAGPTSARQPRPRGCGPETLLTKPAGPGLLREALGQPH